MGESVGETRRFFIQCRCFPSQGGMRISVETGQHGFRCGPGTGQSPELAWHGGSRRRQQSALRRWKNRGLMGRSGSQGRIGGGGVDAGEFIFGGGEMRFNREGVLQRGDR